MLQQAAGVQRQLHDLLERQVLRLLAHHVDFGDERRQIGSGLARYLVHGVVQRKVGRARGILQLLDGARANAARRKIDHAQKAGVVARAVE